VSFPSQGQAGPGDSDEADHSKQDGSDPEATDSRNQQCHPVPRIVRAIQESWSDESCDQQYDESCRTGSDRSSTQPRRGDKRHDRRCEDPYRQLKGPSIHSAARCW